ncbi:MAG: DUF452 family protein [Bacteroidales bacterium]
MKHTFIRQGKSPVLDLIFAGWGMDQHPFLQEATDNDLCICYDYSDLSLDLSIFESYHHIRLLAWSMGVWSAARTFENSDLPFVMKVAVNGTLYPIDDLHGIPRTIFSSTLEHLSVATIDKFNRRMCGTKEQKSRFDQIAPLRSVESLRNELLVLYNQVESSPIPAFKYDKAIIGTKDLIFPSENQRSAWKQEKETRITEIAMAHYPENFISFLTE